MKNVSNCPKRPAWRILDRVADDFYILNRTQNGHVRYVPLYILQLELPTARAVRKAEWNL